MDKDKKVFLFYISERGKTLAESLKSFLGKGEILRLKEAELSSLWKENHLLIFVMALGIVVRVCKEFIQEKGKDPGIIVIDELGKNVISFLGGHYAEVNKLTLEISTYLSSHPVITTTSDNLGLPPLDLWIKKLRFFIKNEEKLYEVMTKFNEKGKLLIYLEEFLEYGLPLGCERTSDPSLADIIITYRERDEKKLTLIPKVLWAGIGFHEILTEEDLEKIFLEHFKTLGLSFYALKGVATIDKKMNFLPLKNFTLKFNLDLRGFGRKALSQVQTLSYSEKVMENIGIPSVSEASALLASQGKLLYLKQKYSNLTIAIALESFKKRGKLYIVGIGPGALEYLTIKALRILTQIEAIVGYKSYIKLIRPLIKNQEIYEFGMTQEIDRAQKAIELALSGKDTALISGGDPGIYGMASLVIELLYRNNLSLEFEIVPGISALNIGNALLGSPLANDFAVLSLSDRLTPWETIETRLRLLAEGDFPIVIYNPRSQGRKTQLSRALQILREKKAPDTLVGIINAATRENEEIIITNLLNFPEEKVGMESLIIIGEKGIKLLGRYLIAERGYERKYEGKFKISPSYF